MTAPREVEGEATAAERLEDLAAKGQIVTHDWSAYCGNADYCTRPCHECGSDANRARDDKRPTV